MPAGATYEPIATTTLASNQATYTFSSIPGTYTDLVLVCVVTADVAGAALGIVLNGDTATNYSSTRISGEGTTASSARSSNASRMSFLAFPTTGTSTTIPSFAKIHLFSYAGSTNKTVLSEGSNDQNGSGDLNRTVGLWRSTAAITSIQITPGSGVNWKTGSTFTLYGIKAA